MKPCNWRRPLWSTCQLFQCCHAITQEVLSSIATFTLLQPAYINISVICSIWMQAENATIGSHTYKKLVVSGLLSNALKAETVGYQEHMTLHCTRVQTTPWHRESAKPWLISFTMSAKSYTATINRLCTTVNHFYSSKRLFSKRCNRIRPKVSVTMKRGGTAISNRVTSIPEPYPCFEKNR